MLSQHSTSSLLWFAIFLPMECVYPEGGRFLTAVLRGTKALVNDRFLGELTIGESFVPWKRLWAA